MDAEARAAQREAAEYVVEQLQPLDVRIRAMFGGYCLYCDEKPVALMTGGDLFLKPTEVGADVLAGSDLSPPYPGAKDHHRVPTDLIDDVPAFQDLVQRTADVLPAQRPRRRSDRP